VEINKRFDTGQSAVANLKKKTEILLEIRENLNQDECTKNGNAAVITLKVYIYLLHNVVYMQIGGWIEGVVTGNSLLRSN